MIKHVQQYDRFAQVSIEDGLGGKDVIENTHTLSAALHSN